ncbi:MAG: hypothetical protein M0C28_39830 [Candidatus Moduliflexus flocculans]|nr:hypothetical protein [Candidatus Moduliflexus flocculans]
MAYYIPETWSKIGKLFNYPFIYGRGLDARPGDHGRRRDGDQHRAPLRQRRTRRASRYSKMPDLQFPVDDRGPGLPRPGRDLLLEGGPLRRLQGLARRRPGLLRAVR